MKAAVKLRADLYQAIHDYPSSKHVIIAHSHGGNVALYALKDAELRSRVSGLVTLATPFLFVESRRLEWVIVLTAVGAASHVAFYTLFLALMILLNGMDTIPLLLDGMRFPPTPNQSLWASITFFVSRLMFVFVVLGLGLSAALKLGEWVYHKGTDWLRRQQRRALACYPRLVYHGLHILNIQAPFDEPRLLLRVFSKLADVPLNLLFHPVAVAVALIALAGSGARVALKFNEVSTSTLPTGVNALLIWVVETFWVLTFSWFAVTILSVLYAPIVIICQTFLRGHAAGFGLEKFAINMALRIRSAPRPTIRGAIVIDPGCGYDEWRRERGRWLDLHHSWVYKAPDPAAAIGRFMNLVAVRESAPPPILSEFEFKPAMRRVARAFRSTWLERGLAYLAMALAVLLFIAPTSIGAAWLFPGMQAGDHAVVVNLPFLTARLIERRGAIAAVDFSDYQTGKAQRAGSLWRRITSPKKKILPLIFMRVVRLPGEEPTFDRQSLVATVATVVPDSEPTTDTDLLRAVCLDERQSLLAQPPRRISAGYVQMESLETDAKSCMAVVPLERITGRVFATFPNWHFWAWRNSK